MSKHKGSGENNKDMCDITLMGDSVLDNFYWLEDKERDLTYELKEVGFNVNNIAVDESRLEDIINGVKPHKSYMEGRQQRKTIISYPVNSSGMVVPLRLLEENPTETCIVSIGGNDLRVNMAYLLLGIDNFVNSVFTTKFKEDMINAMKLIKSFSPKTVLVLPYTPYIGQGSVYNIIAPFYESVYEKIRVAYKDVAINSGVALFDLSKTFDCFDRSHYGSTEIEPSNYTTKCMANYIKEIVNDYDPKRTYFAPKCGDLRYD